MKEIPVHYNLAVGVSMIVVGIFVLGTALFLGDNLLTIVGTINTVVALGFTLQPWFVLFDDRVELRNLLGMTMKRHEFSSLADLEVRDGKLYRKGESRPLKGVGGWLARGSDLEHVRAAIEQAGG